MKEDIIYNKNGSVIKLIEKDSTVWEKVEGTNSLKLIPNYEYMLKVNSDIVWISQFKEKLNYEIVDDSLVIETESNMLLPLINIPLENLLYINNIKQFNNYVDSKKEEKERQEFEIVRDVYLEGIEYGLDKNPDMFVPNQYFKELFLRINEPGTPENKALLIGLIDLLLDYLTSTGKMVDCLEILNSNIFELRSKLKKYPEVVLMLCMEFKINPDDLLKFEENHNKKM